MKLSATVHDSAPLTKRERQVYALLAEGLTRQQIAARLCRSMRTIDAHINHILDKLDAENAHHAVGIGVAGGFLSIVRRVLCMLLVFGLTHGDVNAVRVRVRTRESSGICRIRET